MVETEGVSADEISEVLSMVGVLLITTELPNAELHCSSCSISIQRTSSLKYRSTNYYLHQNRKGPYFLILHRSSGFLNIIDKCHGLSLLPYVHSVLLFLSQGVTGNDYRYAWKSMISFIVSMTMKHTLVQFVGQRMSTLSTLIRDVIREPKGCYSIPQCTTQY